VGRHDVVVKLGPVRLAIAHINHAETGGTERILNEVARRLAERGHEVTILCRRRAVASHPGLQFVLLRGLALGSAWRMWAFAHDVERHVRDQRYDLVFALGKSYTHDVVRASGGCHATWIERRRRARGLSGHGHLGLKDRLALDIERRAYLPGAYRRVVVNSRLVGDDLQRRHGVPAHAIDVVPNGVDLDEFRPRPAEERGAWRRSVGLRDEDFAILFLGNGFERKGLARAIDAFAQLAGAHPRAVLVVVGRDSDQQRYEQRVEALRLGRRVRFLGPRSDPAASFAACDLHVMPTWYDSFGFTLLEAMACGVPVVATDGAGAAELMDDGRHGAVVPWDASATRLADALASWCEPGRAVAASAAVRTRAESYGFDTTMARLVALLEKVATESRTACGAGA